ncbi:Lipoprotein [Pontibacter korlensis]
MIQAIEKELQERGYTKVDENPDVLVAYDVSVSVPEEKDKTEKFSQGFGYSYGYMSGYRYDYGHADMPGYRSVDLFKEGTLIIDFINPRSNMLLWRGWAEGAVNPKDNYKAVENKVEEVIGQL